jgi:hypothetical protein
VAILGTFIDKQTVSRAGDGLTGVTVGTLAHSLPATNPELFLPILRSAESVGVNSAVSLLAIGGNASLLTIGFRVSSAVSCPTLLYDVFAAVFYSSIR